MANRRIKVKPGKTQSKAGFIALSHYKNGFTEEGMAAHEIVIEDGDEIKSYIHKPQEEDIEVKLVKLESLYNQGLITHEEYEAKRKEFLDEF